MCIIQLSTRSVNRFFIIDPLQLCSGVISAVRKFMEMKELTPALLNELIERIEVYETEGTGKNRTQRIMIYYRFVGYIEISGGDRKTHHTAETRKQVAVQYLKTKTEQSA